MATAEQAPATGVGDAQAVAWYALAPDDVVERLATDSASGL